MFELIKLAGLVIVAIIGWCLFVYISASIFASAWYTEKRTSMRLWNEYIEGILANYPDCENYKAKEQSDG